MWTVATAADIGGRDSQQDRVEVFSTEDGNELLAILADGMGGHEGGGLAADVIVETGRVLWDAYLAKPMGPAELLEAICNEAHRLANEIGEKKGLRPHATYVALHLNHKMAHWAHVGDSRLYLFRDGVLEHRTKDDSVAQTLVDTGKIDENDMANHPDANKVLASVGGSSEPTAHVGHADLQEGDGFLLCSDGVWGALEPEEMGRLVKEEPPCSAARKMVELAVKRAAKDADNASAAVIRMDPVKLQEIALRDNTINTLNELIAICHDSCKSLSEAIDKIKDEKLEGTFKEMLAERAVVRDNLIDCLAGLGVVHEEGGTVAGTGLRVFSKIKTALLKNDQLAVIEALEAMEDRVKNKLLDALKERLPAEVQQVIQDQLDSVLASHDLVSAMRYANQ